MAYYADLEPCDYFGPFRRPYLTAVGWLERRREYRRGGDLSPEFWNKLLLLLADPWTSLGVCGGMHDCDLCRLSAGVRGINYLIVPGDETLYISPDYIHHYIDAHDYCPPEAYCRAVMRCPPPRSMEFLRAVNKAGGKELLRAND